VSNDSIIFLPFFLYFAHFPKAEAGNFFNCPLRPIDPARLQGIQVDTRPLQVNLSKVA
jgi:hypothetical protein